MSRPGEVATSTAQCSPPYLYQTVPPFILFYDRKQPNQLVRGGREAVPAANAHLGLLGRRPAKRSEALTREARLFLLGGRGCKGGRNRVNNSRGSVKRKRVEGVRAIRSRWSLSLLRKMVSLTYLPMLLQIVIFVFSCFFCARRPLAAAFRPTV